MEELDIREFLFGIVRSEWFCSCLELPVLNYVYFGYNAGENFYYVTITKTSKEEEDPMIDDGNSFHHVGSVFIGTLLSCFVSCSGVSQDIYRFLRRKHSLTYRCRAHSTTLILRSMRQLLVCFDTGLSFQCGMESTVRILGDYSPPTLKEHFSISYSISYSPSVHAPRKILFVFKVF